MSWKLDELEPMTQEIEDYYSKMIYSFVRAVEEIGLNRVLLIVNKQLEKDIKERKTSLEEATQALENTKEIIERLATLP